MKRQTGSEVGLVVALVWCGDDCDWEMTYLVFPSVVSRCKKSDGSTNGRTDGCKDIRRCVDEPKKRLGGSLKAEKSDNKTREDFKLNSSTTLSFNLRP